MSFYSRVEEFAGLPIADYDARTWRRVADPAAVAWRVDWEYAGGPPEFAEHFDRFVADLGSAATAVVIGEWGGSHSVPPPFDLLSDRAAALPNLRALFVGDITEDFCQVSWMAADDPAPVLAAYPRLAHLRVRGSSDFRPVAHAGLRALQLESGGLPGSTVRAVGASGLPRLERLELWLGDPDYAGDTTVDDLAEIFGGTRLPALRHLGVRNAHDADAIAAALATAPVVARLEHLDLSMGTLGDEGVRALLAGQPLTHLASLTLRHHYVSPELAGRLAAELPGVEIDLGERQAAFDGVRYVSVGE